MKLTIHTLAGIVRATRTIREVVEGTVTVAAFEAAMARRINSGPLFEALIALTSHVQALEQSELDLSTQPG